MSGSSGPARRSLRRVGQEVRAVPAREGGADETAGRCVRQVCFEALRDGDPAGAQDLQGSRLPRCVQRRTARQPGNSGGAAVGAGIGGFVAHREARKGHAAMLHRAPPTAVGVLGSQPSIDLP